MAWEFTLLWSRNSEPWQQLPALHCKIQRWNWTWTEREWYQGKRSVGLPELCLWSAGCNCQDVTVSVVFMFRVVSSGSVWRHSITLPLGQILSGVSGHMWVNEAQRPVPKKLPVYRGRHTGHGPGLIHSVMGVCRVFWKGAGFSGRLSWVPRPNRKNSSADGGGGFWRGQHAKGLGCGVTQTAKCWKGVVREGQWRGSQIWRGLASSQTWGFNQERDVGLSLV